MLTDNGDGTSTTTWDNEASPATVTLQESDDGGVTWIDDSVNAGVTTPFTIPNPWGSGVLARAHVVDGMGYHEYSNVIST